MPDKFYSSLPVPFAAFSSLLPVETGEWLVDIALWGVYLHLLRIERLQIERLRMVSIVCMFVVIELLGTEYFRAYEYLTSAGQHRLVPLFVPPGHWCVYDLARQVEVAFSTLGGEREVRNGNAMNMSEHNTDSLCKQLFNEGEGLVALCDTMPSRRSSCESIPAPRYYAFLLPFVPVQVFFVYRGIDNSGVLLFAILLLLLRFSSSQKKRLYISLTYCALTLELYGTSLRTWAWRHDLGNMGLGIWTAWNPPLLIGSVYAMIDIFGLDTVVRLVTWLDPVTDGSYRTLEDCA